MPRKLRGSHGILLYQSATHGSSDCLLSATEIPLSETTVYLIPSFNRKPYSISKTILSISKTILSISKTMQRIHVGPHDAIPHNTYTYQILISDLEYFFLGSTGNGRVFPNHLLLRKQKKKGKTRLTHF